MTAPDDQPAAGRRVSMSDVARHAGVSQKTVSRVVNGEPHVRPEVQERVERAIAELRFRPNSAARAFRTNRSRRIGVISIGSLLHGPAGVLAGLEAAIREAGYATSLVRTSTGEPEEVQPAIDLLVDEGVDAIALSEPVDARGAVEIPTHLPVLSLSYPTTYDDPALIVVGADQYTGARAATEHLLALGHRTVWHIGGPSDWEPSRTRVAGWRDALAEVDAPEPDVVPGDWTPASGHAAMLQLLTRPDVTAVFAANDHMAVGAIRAITRAGLRVPQDISVVGFDDTPESEYLTPALTTLRQDFAELGRQGVHRLVRAIDGHPPRTPRHLIPVQLVVRESTAPPNPERAPLRSV